MSRRSAITDFLRDLQDRICQTFEGLDGGARFREDAWERPGGGGGRSRVLEGGRILERGGVGFSAVRGKQLPPGALEARPTLTGEPFFATGISLVLHPQNPHAPTVHMNYRYFEIGEDSSATPADGAWWFGGGADLTPSYVYDDDARHFHASHKAWLDRTHPSLHPSWKAWCDEYFYIPHRHEARGVGGVFFDYQDGHRPLYAGGNPETAERLSTLETPALDFETLLKTWQGGGQAFLDAYLPILERRSGQPFTDAERQWQLYRRGRYVEFNLVHDRGTRFGLLTGGRTESVLMSLPPLARWEYALQPEPGSPEAFTLERLQARD